MTRRQQRNEDTGLLRNAGVRITRPLDSDLPIAMLAAIPARRVRPPLPGDSEKPIG